jgi:hypothetical protein
VLGGAGGDDLADVGGAREEDVVEALLEEGRGGVAVALDARADARHDGGVDVLGEELGLQARASGGHVARLEDDGVARGDGGGHGAHGEHDGVVPRTDDEDDAQGLLLQPLGRGPREQVEPELLGGGPGGEVLDHFLGASE